MNQTYVHLLLSHLPVFATALGFFILIYGLWSKSDHTKIAGYFLMIVASIGAGISYLTGESAEHTAEDIAGISKDAIEQHEDFAKTALIGLIILGVIAIIGIVVIAKKTTWVNMMVYITLVASLVGFYLVARTANLGGKIRHTEISSSTITQNGTYNENDANTDNEDVD